MSSRVPTHSNRQRPPEKGIDFRPVPTLQAVEMPTTPLQRLLFAQGGDCFFCRKKLTKADASVEHLVALTHGGKDNDENCVACCKSLNHLLGRMSLKEKLQIVMNQRGAFVCPAVQPNEATKPGQPKAPSPRKRTHDERFALVLADLQKRGSARPSTADKLLNTIRSQLTQLGEPVAEADALLGELRARSFVAVAEDKVTYALPADTA